MAFPFWPSVFTAAPQIDWRPVLVTQSPGQSVDGTEPAIYSDGGGKWELSLSGVWVRGQAYVKAARALRGQMQGGAMPIVVDTCECGYAPRADPPAGDTGEVPHSDETPFSDGSLYAGRFVNAVFAADAGLRATTLTLRLTEGAPLTAGEAFSVYHAPPRGYTSERGKRRYEVNYADEPVYDESDPTIFTQTVIIHVPLRAAVSAGTLADFDSVGAVMRLVNADAFFDAIEMGRRTTLNPVFREAF